MDPNESHLGAIQGSWFMTRTANDGFTRRRTSPRWERAGGTLRRVLGQTCDEISCTACKTLHKADRSSTSSRGGGGSSAPRGCRLASWRSGFSAAGRSWLLIWTWTCTTSWKSNVHKPCAKRCFWLIDSFRGARWAKMMVRALRLQRPHEAPRQRQTRRKSGAQSFEAKAGSPARLVEPPNGRTSRGLVVARPLVSLRSRPAGSWRLVPQHAPSARRINAAQSKPSERMGRRTTGLPRRRRQPAGSPAR
jgi:hypothetical protein